MNASMLGVVPVKNRGNDYIFDSTSVQENETNRTIQRVDLKRELDFTNDKYIGKQGNIGYYFRDVDDFQCPKARCPFGFQFGQDMTTGAGTIELDLDDETRAFLKELDSVCCKQIIANYSRWFGSKPKQLTEKTICSKDIYKSTVLKSKNSELYSDRYKIKVFTKDGKNKTKIFLYDEKSGDIKPGCVDDLNKNCYVIPNIQVNNLWFKGNKSITRTSVTLVASRLLIFENKSRITQMHSFGQPSKRKVDFDDDTHETKRIQLDDQVNYSYL